MPTFQKIILTNNSTNTSAPVASDIDQGELALNLVDGSIYFKDTTNTIRELGLASSNAGTANPGSISQHISESSDGVGIGVNPESGFDLKVNGKVKLNDILSVPKIFRVSTNSSLVLSGGTDAAATGANIELYGSTVGSTALQNNAYIDVNEFYVRKIDNVNATKYIALGTSAPSINIGGPNTTGVATLNIGNARTDNANSQIVLRSRIGNAPSGLSKFIRFTDNNLKAIHHGAGDFILQADSNNAIKLATSLANTDNLTSGKVNLVARDGHVKIGDLDEDDDVDINAALRVEGRILANNILLSDTNAIIWESTLDANSLTDGNARLTYNDGGGNIQMRWGHKYNGGNKFTHGGDAIYIGSYNNFDSGAADASIDLKVSTNTGHSIGDEVTWGDEFKIFKDKATYTGKIGLGSAINPQGDIHVAGNGGADNVIIEANSSDSDGARITLRTTTGTFASRTNTTENQKLGEIVAQGYRTTGASGIFKPAGRIDWIALNNWTGQTNENAKMVFKVRGLKTSTNTTTSEPEVMKLYATDGGKVAINCPVDLTNPNSATLHIGGKQKLGNTKDEYIEHLRLDVDHSGSAPIDEDKLVFRSHRRATDDSTPRWYSASHRIQRIVDSTHMGFIDFCSHVDGTTSTVGTKELFVFGEGYDAESASGNIDEAKFLTILHDGRLVQYGQDPDARANSGGDDLMIGQASGTRGMTILSENDSKGNIFFADQDHQFPGMISYDHNVNRMDISCGAEGYPNTGEVFNGIQITSEGNVGIQLTDSTPDEALHVNGKILAEDDITAFSDERLKENIETIPNALEKVSQLRGVEFTRKDTGEKSIGVIAQEIEQVIPEVVSTTNDEAEMKSVAYGNVVGLLIEAIKDLQQEVEELKRGHG